MTTRFEPGQYVTVQVGAIPFNLPSPAKAPATPFAAWDQDALRAAMMGESIASAIVRHPPTAGQYSECGKSGGAKSKATKIHAVRGEVLAYLAEHGPTKVVDIAADIGRNDSTVRDCANRLAEDGLIRLDRGLRGYLICALVAP